MNQWHRIQLVLGSKSDLLAQQGTLVASWRKVDGRTWGPYYSLRYREQGKQCSLYLGSSKRLAVQVRRWLRARQQPLRLRRKLDQQRALVRASLRQHKTQWSKQLAEVGLRLRGNEIRGWRNVKINQSTATSDEQLARK